MQDDKPNSATTIIAFHTTRIVSKGRSARFPYPGEDKPFSGGSSASIAENRDAVNERNIPAFLAISFVERGMPSSRI